MKKIIKRLPFVIKEMSHSESLTHLTVAESLALMHGWIKLTGLLGNVLNSETQIWDTVERIVSTLTMITIITFIELHKRNEWLENEMQKGEIEYREEKIEDLQAQIVALQPSADFPAEQSSSKN